MVKPPLYIVLVSPRVPDNIGAAARAAQNMGASKLILVNPYQHNSERALSVACASKDFLLNANIYDNLSDALRDAITVVGTSRRRRMLKKRVLQLPNAFPVIFKDSTNSPIYLLFGTEDKGLSNDELDLCQCIITIPTTRTYQSINLAQSIMLVAYQYFITGFRNTLETEDKDIAGIEDKECLYREIIRVMGEIGFFSRNKRLPISLVRCLRVIFKSSSITKTDIRTLHGLFTQMHRYIELKWFNKPPFPSIEYPEINHRNQD